MKCEQDVEKCIHDVEYSSEWQQCPLCGKYVCISEWRRIWVWALFALIPVYVAPPIGEFVAETLLLEGNLYSIAKAAVKVAISMPAFKVSKKFSIKIIEKEQL